MSSMTVGYIVDLARKKLVDEGDTRDFEDSDLIGFYNLTLRTIVSFIPRAYTIIKQDHELAAGLIQSIPSDGIKFVDFVMNMGADGATPGSPIREVDYDAMKSLVPEWTAETAEDEIQHYMKIPGMDASVLVSPPSDGTGKTMLVYAAMPPTSVYDVDGEWESDRVPISDEFVSAIPDGILFHSYDDDSDVPGTIARSQMYFNRMMQLLGLKAQQVAGRK